MVVGAQWLRDGDASASVLRERLAHAGRLSGESRRKQAKAGPSQVQEMEAKLLREGKSPRETASIIARRLGVTPEHIRQIRKKEN